MVAHGSNRGSRFTNSSKPMAIREDFYSLVNLSERFIVEMRQDFSQNKPAGNAIIACTIGNRGQEAGFAKDARFCARKGEKLALQGDKVTLIKQFQANEKKSNHSRADAGFFGNRLLRGQRVLATCFRCHQCRVRPNGQPHLSAGCVADLHGCVFPVP